MKRKTRIWLAIVAAAVCMALCSGALAEAVNSDVIADVQEALNQAGFACGSADGIAGKRTTAAITAYQKANGLAESGTITDELLVSLGLAEPEQPEQPEDEPEAEPEAPAEPQEQPEAPEAPESEPADEAGVEQPEAGDQGAGEAPTTRAVVNGSLLTVVNGLYEFYEYDAESGWLNMFDGTGKGVGYTQDIMLNVLTGQAIYGGDGQEVVFCDKGILQLEWRDTATGDPMDVGWLCGGLEDGVEPATYEMYSVIYDLAGTVVEETPLVQFTQMPEEQFYDEFGGKVDPVAMQAFSKYHAHDPMNDYIDFSRKNLVFKDVDGDAVACTYEGDIVYGADGEYLICYPDTPADGLGALWSSQQNAISVCHWDEDITEVFLLN